MKYLILMILFSSCAVLKSSRNDRILSCVDRFIDEAKSDVVFKQCREIYGTRH